MENFLKVLKIVGLITSSICLAFSIHERDLTESMAWGIVILCYAKDEVVKNK